MRRLVLFFLAITIAYSASAWGPKGHDIVAYIAEQHLSKCAKRNIEQILGGHSMVYVSNWLDNASHTPQYAHTKTWHYCNVDPDEESYFNSEKCSTGDVVIAIDNIISRLHQGELSLQEERVELMMLIHLVGDMHCPMHAGRKQDRGGNGTTVKFFGKKSTLHSVWDSDLLESTHRWSYTEWQKQIDRVSRKEQKRITQGSTVDWIEESVQLAHDVYENTPAGTSISYDYINHYAPAIEHQLLKGGLRLAAILNRLY